MERRWIVLGVVGLARSGVGFQFVAIAALMLQLKADLGINHAQIGVLLGLFLIAGVFLSLPAGMIASRIGDHLTLRIGLIALIVGAALVAMSASFTVALTGRLLGGIGAVATSVVGSKLLTDWFIGREIRTAMSLFGLTWPAGIGVGMTILPLIGAWINWQTAVMITGILPALALILVGLIPQHAEGLHDPNPGGEPTAALWSLDKKEFWTILAGGLAWPLMNGGGYILFTTHGPGLLMERGATAISANMTAGLLSWLIIVTIPLGGLFADRTGRSTQLFAIGCLVAAVAIAMVPIGGPAVLWVVLASALGFTVGPVMALPSDVLKAESRATGFGLYYSIYYLGMGTLPALAGWILDRTGSIPAVIWLSALCLMLAPAFYIAARLLHGHANPS